MSSEALNLFKPLKVGSSTLKQRIAMAPLTRLRSANHVPDELVTVYYRQRAAGAKGSLLITEATLIAPESGGIWNAPGLWSSEQVTAWKNVTDAVHKEGSHMYAQLWDPGRMSNPQLLEKEGPYPYVSASAVPLSNSKATPRALTKEEVKQRVQSYRKAARNAIDAGFDGIELHGANSYLIDQFLHETTNKRDDEYGGSIENRARFALEVIDAVADEIGAERVAIRLSPWSDYGEMDFGPQTIPQFSYLISEIEKRGIDGKRLSYIHVVEPRVMDGETSSYGKTDREINNFVRFIWTGVIIRCGQFGKDVEEMKRLTEKDDKLILAVGRLYISNPDIIPKLKNGQKADQYDRSTFYYDGKSDRAIGYTKDFTK